MLVAAMHLVLSIVWARGAEASLVINWTHFLARHDLIWEALPKAWDEGAFIGNGLLGAMIYSESSNALQWDVGRSDVTDRGNRIAIGRFALLPAGAAPSGTMRLDLWNAEARGTLRTDSTEVEWRSFTHSDKLVSVIELAEARETEPSKIVFQHLAALPAREEYKHESVPDDVLNPNPTFGQSGPIQWCLQPFKAGGGYVVAWAERALPHAVKTSSLPPRRRRAFFFTVDFSLAGTPAPAKAIAQIHAALTGNFEDLVQSHRAWWHGYYPESFLSIPDTRMESFYWIQMYKLASGTRADRPALDLMGPWFRRTPWPKIWWNLNIQLTYWPVYVANRLALGESLTRMIDAGRTNLINNAPPEWREDSAAIKRTSSYDCRSSLSSSMDGKGRELGNLTWALHNYWLQYRYSGDEKLLRVGLYPILKRSIAFYLHLLKLGEDGKLHLPNAISPEYPETAPDTNYDLSLLRWGLITLLAANERLGLNDPMADKWRDTLGKLTPFPVDPQTGYMIGAGVPLSQSHRHFSHLFMVYPLHLVDPQSAADRPLIEKSLDHWLGSRSALRGYSFTAASAMSSWLGRNDDTARDLNEILEFRTDQAKTRYHVTANSMYLEAGPVIETPLAAAASIHEILLQSWSMEPFGTHIRVFPAVPNAWKDAAFHKLLAEGAFEVSAVRRGGKTRFVQLTSRAGAPCRVSTSLAEPVIASGKRSFKVATETDDNGHRITFIDLRKGETVLLMSANEKLSPDDLVIEPVATQEDRLNFYGSPKGGKNVARGK
ncbi:MAG: alpha-L-fucosidase 2 [Verrucomicrobiota bacterium]